MPQFISVDSIELEVLNGFPGPPGSHFQLANGKVFGFPWEPDHLYRIGQWIVGVSLREEPGWAEYSAHEVENGGTMWNAHLRASSRFTMEPDGHGFVVGTVQAQFDRSISQVLEFRAGYWVVLDYNASVRRGQNVAFVSNDGHVSRLISDQPGKHVLPYSSVRVNNDGLIEAWDDRYMAVIDPATLHSIATRP